MKKNKRLPLIEAYETIQDYKGNPDEKDLILLKKLLRKFGKRIQLISLYPKSDKRKIFGMAAIDESLSHFEEALTRLSEFNENKSSYDLEKEYPHLIKQIKHCIESAFYGYCLAIELCGSKKEFIAIKSYKGK